MEIQRGRLPLALILLSALACEGYTEKLQELWIHRSDEIEYTYKRHVQSYAYAICVLTPLAIMRGVLDRVIPKLARAAFTSTVGLIGRTSAAVVRMGIFIAKLTVIWGALNATIVAGAVALETFGVWAMVLFLAWRTPDFIWRKFRVKVFHFFHILALPLLVSTLLVSSLICRNDHSPRDATENPRGVDLKAPSDISYDDVFVECDPKAPLAPGYVRIAFGATINGVHGCTVNGAVPRGARVSSILARVAEICGFEPSKLRLRDTKTRALLDPADDLRGVRGPLKVEHVYLIKSELYVRGFGRTVVLEVAECMSIRTIKRMLSERSCVDASGIRLVRATGLLRSRNPLATTP